MAQTSQSLPDINNLACGVVKSYLYYDDSIAGLVVPTRVPFLDISEIKESIDIEAGTTDIENLKVVLAEDYSTYSEGFWHKLINGNPTYYIEIMFTLMEGTDETFLFRGILNRQLTINTEYYLDVLSGTPTSWVRGVEIQLISSLKRLESVTLSDLFTEVNLHKLPSAAFGINVAPIGVTIASMMKLAYNVTYYAFPYINNSQDFYPSNGGLLNTWSQAGIAFDGGGFWVSSNPESWLNRFANAYELLRLICFTFGLIPKYQFGTDTGLIDADPANNNHRILFSSRGNLITDPVTHGKFIESSFKSDTARKARTIRITDYRDSTLFTYYLNGILQTAATPPPTKFDIDETVDFSTKNLGADTKYWDLLLFNSGTGQYDTLCDNVYWYNYQTNALTTAAGFYQALTQYLYNRFSGGRIEWTRTYGSLSANNGTSDSQRWNRTLMGCSIHDGVSSRNFYSTEVSKNLKENKSKVVWVEQ